MELKRLGHVWQRSRYCLKKNAIWSGSSKPASEPPDRSAWSKVGETHAMESGRSQRLNVIGALLSPGRLLMTELGQSVKGLWFFWFSDGPDRAVKEADDDHPGQSVDPYGEGAGEPYRELLKEKGMRFYFLPPYSPELNRIEVLWKKMKYGWLQFKSFTPVELEQAIDEIRAGFGSEYQLTSH